MWPIPPPTARPVAGRARRRRLVRSRPRVSVTGRRGPLTVEVARQLRGYAGTLIMAVD